MTNRQKLLLCGSNQSSMVRSRSNNSSKFNKPSVTSRSAVILVVITLGLFNAAKAQNISLATEPVSQNLEVQEIWQNRKTKDVSAEWQLSERCPPGFQLKANRCILRHLYQLYDSLYNQGVGGLKTALPPARDGFSPKVIDLGRYLFFDPLLSGDHSLSCASCHHPDLGFSDGRAKSVGIQGTTAKRSAPSLWNVAFLKSFFWDGRASSLEQQMQGPLYDPGEMGNSPQQLLADLQANAIYLELFRQAFGDQSQVITLDKIYTALAAFEASLISLNSRYDQYAHGYHQALNANEIEGLNIFRSFVARCAECHTPPLFTNQQIAVIGTPPVADAPIDPGAEVTFNNPDLRGGFKVPSLRNIARTAPYMHAGQFTSLREAVEFYTKGRGHAVPKQEKLLLHWHIWEPRLTDRELDRLVDFLNTLTDEQFKPKIPSQVPSGLAPIGQNPLIELQSSNPLLSKAGE